MPLIGGARTITFGIGDFRADLAVAKANENRLSAAKGQGRTRPVLRRGTPPPACSFDKRRHNRSVFRRVDRGVIQAMRSQKIHGFGAPNFVANPTWVTELDCDRGSRKPFWKVREVNRSSQASE